MDGKEFNTESLNQIRDHQIEKETGIARIWAACYPPSPNLILSSEAIYTTRTEWKALFQ